MGFMSNSRLYVAAGGGGDAITAAMIHRERGAGYRPLIASFSWDRLLIDPMPGPRAAADFEGLEPVGSHNYRVLPTTRAVEPAGSLLPRLSSELDADLLLLDPLKGAVGLSRQLRELKELYQLEGCTLVDVGGDVLARGKEPELRSPLADSLALAAMMEAWSDTTVSDTAVLVTGPGLDGEFSADEVLKRCGELKARSHGTISGATAKPFAPLFTWHPSEASGLLCLAALGYRGKAEVRDQGWPVDLSEDSPRVQALESPAVLERNEIAQAIRRSEALEQAEASVERFGRESEIAYERRKASILQQQPRCSLNAEDLVAQLPKFAANARARGIRFMTMRCLAESMALDGETLQGLKERLANGGNPAYLGIALDLERV